MADPTTKVKVKLETDSASVSTLEKEVSNRISKGAQNALNRLGFGKFAPIFPESSTKSAKATEGAEKAASSAMSVANLANGVAAGLAAGGVVALLDIMAKGIMEIFNAVMDFPLVTAIFKLFKVILTALLLPLIPILKPVLMLLAWFAKMMIDAFKPSTEQIVFSPLDPNSPINKMITSIKDKIVEALGTALEPMKTWADAMWEKYVAPGLNGVLGFGNMLWTQKFSPGFDTVKNFGNKIWDIFVLALDPLAPIKTWIWDDLLLPAFTSVATFVTNVWKDNIGPAFDSLIKSITDLNLGKLIYDAVAASLTGKAPVTTNKSSSGVSKLIVEAIKGASATIEAQGTKMGGTKTSTPSKTPIASGSSSADSILNPSKKTYTKSTKVKDFILTPNGALKTDPNDFIIGTKNPKALGGGGMTVNINIDKPTVRSDSDIKNLVQQISSELYKMQRRYNSYV